METRTENTTSTVVEIQRSFIECSFCYDKVLNTERAMFSHWASDCTGDKEYDMRECD